MTTTFWIVAGLFCLMAAGLLFVPVWQHRRRAGRWSPVGLVAALAIAPLSLGLYRYVSTWDAEYAARVTEETELADRLVAELETHLASNPNDPEGLSLLARSYVQLGRYAQARAVYERLWALTRSPSNELKLAYAEAQILADRGALVGDAGRMVEDVLAAQPGNAKALWYGGHVALELGRTDIARERWSNLLALNPPEDVGNVIRNQLAMLGGPAAAGPGGQGGAVEPSGPTIRLSVTLGSGRSVADLGPSAQLFVIARAPEGGPPIAVIRRPPSAVPGEFTLSDADSMIQGRSLASYPEIAVVARLSRSGQPTAQAGDWFAETTVRPSESPTVALVIDEVVQ